MEAIFDFLMKLAYGILNIARGMVKSILQGIFPNFDWDGMGGTLIAGLVVVLIIGLCSLV